MSNAIIVLDDVTKTYGGVIANHAVSLTVERGGITGLIGPNGSGKTTLFNSIVGYHPIDSGSIRFEGRKYRSFKVQEIARLGLLRTFQSTRIFSKMTCMRNMLISIPHRKEGFADMFAPRAWRGGRAGRAPAGLRRALREAVPALGQPVLRTAEAPRIRHGADERADRAAARRADRRHQPDADQRPARPPQSRQRRNSASRCSSSSTTCA